MIALGTGSGPNLAPFWNPKSDQIGSKRVAKSIKKVIKNKMRCGIDLGWLLDRFFIDLGPKLGGKMEPSWDQNLKNGGPKTMSTNMHKNDAKKVMRGYARLCEPRVGGSL